MEEKLLQLEHLLKLRTIQTLSLAPIYQDKKKLSCLNSASKAMDVI